MSHPGADRWHPDTAFPHWQCLSVLSISKVWGEISCERLSICQKQKLFLGKAKKKKKGVWQEENLQFEVLPSSWTKVGEDSAWNNSQWLLCSSQKQEIEPFLPHHRWEETLCWWASSIDIGTLERNFFPSRRKKTLSCLTPRWHSVGAAILLTDQSHLAWANCYHRRVAAGICAILSSSTLLFRARPVHLHYVHGSERTQCRRVLQKWVAARCWKLNHTAIMLRT